MRDIVIIALAVYALYWLKKRGYFDTPRTSTAPANPTQLVSGCGDVITPNYTSYDDILADRVRRGEIVSVNDPHSQMLHDAERRYELTNGLSFHDKDFNFGWTADTFSDWLGGLKTRTMIAAEIA